MEIIHARKIKIRHLSAFVETVRQGSLKAASEQIFLTQPTISKTLKDLEDILGVKLLNRDRGGVSLTREGSVFRQFAEQALAAVGHGLASLDTLSAGRSAPLRIGSLPSVSADLLPHVILNFELLSPATPITVEEGPISGLINGLRSGQIDLVIGRTGSPDQMTGLSFTQLYSETVIFAAANGHPMAQVSDLAALSGQRILYPPLGSAIRPLVDRFMIERGAMGNRGKIESVSGAFGRAMTLGPAQAIWIISQGVVIPDIKAGRMIALPIDTGTMSGAIGIMTRAEEDPTPPMRLFRQALNDSLISKNAD